MHCALDGWKDEGIAPRTAVHFQEKIYKAFYREIIDDLLAMQEDPDEAEALAQLQIRIAEYGM